MVSNLNVRRCKRGEVFQNELIGLLRLSRNLDGIYDYPISVVSNDIFRLL